MSKNCFGIISWFPDKEPERTQRINRLNSTFKQLKDIFGDVEYLIVAQNWKDYEVPDHVNAQVFKYNKLGILGARKTLGKHFLESSYDYLIMCDDDVVLEPSEDFTKEYFFEELDKHPKGFMFLQHGWALNLCAISRFIYSQDPMIDIDPEKGEGYEDVSYPNLLHYKYPEKEFKISKIKFVQHKAEYHKNHKSTWDGKSTDHEKLRFLTDYYTEEFKQGHFEINDEVKKKALEKWKNRPKTELDYWIGMMK